MQDAIGQSIIDAGDSPPPENSNMTNTQRMSPKDFSDWLDRVGLSTREAAEALGWSRKSIIYAKRAGAARHIALACQALMHGLKPYRAGGEIKSPDIMKDILEVRELRRLKDITRARAESEKGEKEEALKKKHAKKSSMLKAIKKRADRKERNEAIDMAFNAGASLREIAERTNMSHEGVRKIIASQRKK